MQADQFYGHGTGNAFEDVANVGELLAYEEADDDEPETEDGQMEEENGDICGDDNFGTISGRNAFREKLRAQLDQLNSADD